MKKYAVIHSDDGRGIWRKLETKEDIKDYWYIQAAIDKYGWDDVMPCYINKCGGYHSWSDEKVEMIFECESWPTLRDCDRYREYILNNKYFCCGWISPSGDTYSCGHFGHVSLASDITDFIYSDTYRKYFKETRINAPDDWLINQGWIKIDASKNHYCLWHLVTKDAMNKLNELEERWNNNGKSNN